MFDSISGNYTSIDKDGITVDISGIATDFLKRWICTILTIETSYDFETPLDYSYNPSQIKVTGGEAKLKIIAGSYSIENPTITPGIYNFYDGSSLSNFSMTATIPAGSDIKFHMSADRGLTWKYWDGSAWVLTDNAYGHDNSESEVNLNISKLEKVSGYLFRAILHSETGAETPVLDKVILGGLVKKEYDIVSNTEIRINFPNQLTGEGSYKVEFITRGSLMFYESDFSNINKIPDSLIEKKVKTTNRFFEEKIKGQFRYLFSDYSSDTNPLDRIQNLHEIQTVYCYYLISSVYQDLSIEEGDQNDYKNRQYMTKYKELIKDSLALLSVDTDGNDDLDNLEKSKPSNTGGMLSR